MVITFELLSVVVLVFFTRADLTMESSMYRVRTLAPIWKIVLTCPFVQLKNDDFFASRSCYTIAVGTGWN